VRTKGFYNTRDYGAGMYEYTLTHAYICNIRTLLHEHTRAHMHISLMYTHTRPKAPEVIHAD